MIIIATVLVAGLGLLALLVAYSFGVGILFGAPYLPTMAKERKAALELLDLKPGQTLYDLGCGDGRMLRAAAKGGLNAVGYELSPLFYVIARLVNLRYRRQVRVVLGNYWHADWAKADGIYIFLIDRYMAKFDKKMITLKKPTRVASYTFKIPSRQPAKKSGAVFLYMYP